MSSSTRLISVLTGRGRTVQIVAPLALLLMVGLLLLGAPTTFIRTFRGELLAHAVASGAATFAVTGVFIATKQRQAELLNVILWGAGLTLALEIAQTLVPGRNVELLDVFSGFAGVLLAAIAIEFIARGNRVDAVLRFQTMAAMAASVVVAAILVAGPRRVNDLTDWFGFQI